MHRLRKTFTAGASFALAIVLATAGNSAAPKQAASAAEAPAVAPTSSVPAASETDPRTVEVPLETAGAGDHEPAEREDPEAAPDNRTTPTGADERVVLSASASARGATVVGVTWEPGTASEVLAVEIRTRTGNEWSPWQQVEIEGGREVAQSGSLPVRDGTEPYLAGLVEEVEVSLADVGEGPRDPRLIIVDEGKATDTTQAAAVSQAAASPAGFATAFTSAPAKTGAVGDVALGAASRPTIYSRADWGADESKMTWTPEVGRVLAATVHHTAGTNAYTADQVPALIRGIYTYHADSRGWGDIGYNFLIDKFGRVWEGRAGGVDRGIVGGHAVGYNSTAFGISFMGDHDTADVTAASMRAASQLIAWKFGLHGVRAGATTVINGRTFSTIFGHRDVAETACPGRFLYPRLGELRSLVTSLEGDVSSRTYSRDLTGDGFTDALLLSDSQASVATDRAAGWKGPVQVGSGWDGARTVGPGDWTGDGVSDLMLIDGAGTLWLYSGRADGTWSPRRAIGAGWSVMDMVVGGQDWSGDGRPDLLARRASTGELFLYPSSGSGGFQQRERIGTGWQVMSALAMVGDLDGGIPALVARTHDGVLYTYRGNANGGFQGSRTVLGVGWNVMTAIVGTGDMNDDGRVDIAARDTGGRLWLYVGDGRGGVRGRSQVGSGWQIFAGIVSAGRAGDGQDLFAVRGSDRSLLRYSYLGRGDLSSVIPSGLPEQPGILELVEAGDWDGDGRRDLLTRASSGDLVLHPGDGRGRYAATGRRIGTGWQAMTQVIGGGNWVGTGVPTLVALERRSGRIWLYPGDGRGGFAPRVLLASGVDYVDLIVNGGLWSGGRVPDLLTRDSSTGEMHLRRGNGAGLLGPPSRIGTGWNALADVVGAGDVDGDGKPDLLGKSGDGSVRLYAGNGAGGFYPWRWFASFPVGAALS